MGYGMWPWLVPKEDRVRVRVREKGIAPSKWWVLQQGTKGRWREGLGKKEGQGDRGQTCCGLVLVRDAKRGEMDLRLNPRNLTWLGSGSGLGLGLT